MNTHFILLASCMMLQMQLNAMQTAQYKAPKTIDIATFPIAYYEQYPVSTTYYLAFDFPGLIAGNLHSHGLPEERKAYTTQDLTLTNCISCELKKYIGCCKITFSKLVSFDSVKAELQQRKIHGITRPVQIIAQLNGQTEKEIERRIKQNSDNWYSNELIWSQLNPKFDTTIMERKLRNSQTIACSPPDDSRTMSKVYTFFRRFLPDKKS